MMRTKWPYEPGDPVLQMLVPRLYGSVPTFFAAPLAEQPSDLNGFDVAFLGIPWQAPVPDSRAGAAAASYIGVNLTPHRFRSNSVKYGGYLPELDLDVFEHLRLVDYGDADVVFDLDVTLANVGRKVGEIIDAGCIPLTVGGNGGVSSYPVIQAIGARGGPVAVVNLDAHHDNRFDTAAERADHRNPRWGATWAGRILELPGVDPGHYVHVGLRGPRNDRGAIPRFLERGVKREHIYTYREITRARRGGGAEQLAAEIASLAAADAPKVWIAVDPDVLDLSVAPDFGDEPLGLWVEEVVEIVRQVARAAGRRRFAGLTFMAIPPEALTIQWICMYIVLYTFAGLVEGER